MFNCMGGNLCNNVVGVKDEGLEYPSGRDRGGGLVLVSENTHDDLRFLKGNKEELLRRVVLSFEVFCVVEM